MRLKPKKQKQKPKNICYSILWCWKGGNNKIVDHELERNGKKARYNDRLNA